MDTVANEPLSRRFSVRHLLTELAYVVVIDILIAIFLSAAGISNPFAVNLVMAQCYGISIFATIQALLWVFRPGEKTWLIILIAAAGTIGGYFIGTSLGLLILKRVFSITIDLWGEDMPRTVVVLVAISTTVVYFFYSKARLKADRRIIEQERVRRLSSEKEALEANLRLLQAQVEPHFLFNTLSNVLALIDTDPSRGKTMLSDLIRYLRTSLSRTLPAATTLGQEMDMVRAYLSIQQARMGERLRFIIDLPAVLSGQPFPPMILQPLVENAVKHGLEPKMEGGEVSVTASHEENVVRITVADTGDGFSEYEQAGIGLANVRERVRLIYGEKGRFLLEENRPHGVKAVVEVPKHGL